MARRLIIDCDPGVDDAVALLFAFAARDALDIAAITTVAGNMGAALTARNARIVRQIAGREETPVCAGCARPLVREPVHAPEFHGASGLGDLDPFEPAAPLSDEHAVQAIVRLAMAAEPGELSIAVTGPCTNLATAFTHKAGYSEKGHDKYRSLQHQVEDQIIETLNCTSDDVIQSQVFCRRTVLETNAHDRVFSTYTRTNHELASGFGKGNHPDPPGSPR